jgi:ectoine hydroxylase-related dioxygenase (phytanoyl-CoA dioxygenase family)
MRLDEEMRRRFWEQGYLVVENVLTPAEIEAGRSAVDSLEREGSREDGELLFREGCLHIVWHVPGRRDLLGRMVRHPAVLSLLEDLFGEPPAVVGGIMIAKSPSDNWAIPWHQDTGVWVDRIPPGEPEDIRGGHPVVRTRGLELARCVNARIHLDDALPETGGLWVLPGSHARNLGADGPKQVEHEAGVPAAAPVGSVLFYVPLLFHRSEKGADEAKRRVVHLSYRPASLRLPFAGWYPWGLPEPVTPVPLLP